MKPFHPFYIVIAEILHYTGQIQSKNQGLN